MIFVTGGTGLLGNCIVRELCARGEKVRALCRPDTPPQPFADLEVDIVQGDLSDQTVLTTAMRDCRAVIHSAAYIHIGWENLQLSREVNVEGTERVARACLKHGCRMLHISTVDTLPAATSLKEPIHESSETGVPKTECSYVVSKVEAERLVVQLHQSSGLDAVILNPGFMLAPYDWKPSSGRMFLEVQRAPLVVAPPGGCSFCDARDVASGVVNALDRGQAGRNYILAGENMTYQELWRQMLETSGRKKRVWKFGQGIKVFGKCLDAITKMLPVQEGDVNGAAIAMGCLNHFYCSRRAETELDYRRRPMAETLSEAWDWLANLETKRNAV